MDKNKKDYSFEEKMNIKVKRERTKNILADDRLTKQNETILYLVDFKKKKLDHKHTILWVDPAQV
jgi:hypothetical protein